MSGQALKIAKLHSYLGLIIDHQLLWRPHVDYVCSKAMKQIGLLNHNLHTCPKALKDLSYNQPILDYASSSYLGPLPSKSHH